MEDLTIKQTASLKELGKLQGLDENGYLNGRRVTVVVDRYHNVRIDLDSSVGRVTRAWRAVKRFFGFYQRSVDDMEHLKGLMQNVRADVAMGAEYNDLVQNAFEGLRALYNHYRKDQSVEGLAYKHDILEAFSIGASDFHVARIAADPIEQIATRFKSHHIPLFRIEDLPEVTKIIREKFDRTPTIEDMRNEKELAPYLMRETVSMGPLVDKIYQHGRWGKIFNNSIVSGFLTHALGWLYKKELPKGEARTRSTLAFFRKMHITPYVEFKGELYAYSEFFKRDLRSEESRNAAFTRSLSKAGTERLVGKSDESARTNSFCRLRLLSVDGVRDEIQITGKILSDEHGNEEAVEEEEGYNVRAKFTIQEMLGFKNRFNTRTTVPPTERTKEGLYRAQINNFLKSAGKKHVVVQRLAPADIHHYAQPKNGKVLNLHEALELFQKRGQTIPDGLQKLFDPKSKQSTVAVGGTRKSVSTVATRHQSPLSQNNRKIMVVEHDDGTIAVHCFIGAVGVDDVAVTAKAGEHKQGNDFGYMGFGGSTVVSIYLDSEMEVDERLKDLSPLNYKDRKGVTRHIELETPMGVPILHPRQKN